MFCSEEFSQSRQPVRARRVALIGLVTVLILVCLVAMLPGSPPIRLQAQSGTDARTTTPYASPAGNGGKAQWTINSNDFKSNFPNGFTFTIDAVSSAGKIVLATAYWRHTPNNLKRFDLKVDASG